MELLAEKIDLKNLPVKGRFIRFLSPLPFPSCGFRDDDMDAMEAEEEDGDETVDDVDEVDDL